MAPQNTTFARKKETTQYISSSVKATTKSTDCGRTQKAGAQLCNAGADYHLGRIKHHVVWKKSTQSYFAI